MEPPNRDIPLVVDLDGTLLKTDTLVEGILKLVAKNPFLIFYILVWTLNGKAYLKNKVAKITQLNYSLLPYYHEFYDFLKHEKDKGRKIILVTGAHTSIAMAIGNIFNIFDEIHGTDEINLVGKNKANFLIDRYGLNGFEYAGDSKADLHVWAASKSAIAVNTKKSLISKINKLQPSSTNTDFSNSNIKISVYIKTLLTAMRIKQWIKNSLIFVPLILSQSFASLESVFTSLIAFLAFLCI